MRNFGESRTLAESFTKGVGKEPNRDNWGGTLLKGLNGVLVDITKAVHLEDIAYIKHKDIRAICDAVEWFEIVFEELEEEQKEGKEVRNV